ncbi:MAG: hypothetical protein Q7R56_00120 [Nanoarchaeota archaeon]|nr:hypothetical protein [Nanoarchaeota archaeon]
MKALTEFIAGMVLMVFAGLIILSFKSTYAAVLQFLTAGILVGLFLLGAGLIVLGLSDLKD